MNDKEVCRRPVATLGLSKLKGLFTDGGTTNFLHSFPSFALTLKITMPLTLALTLKIILRLTLSLTLTLKIILTLTLNLTLSGLDCFRQSLGASPLNLEEAMVWQQKVKRMRATEEDINQMISKFNLIVPIMNSQMFPVCLQKESDKIFQEGFDPSIEAGNLTELKTANSRISGIQPEEGIFSSFLKSIFNKS